MVSFEFNYKFIWVKIHLAQNVLLQYKKIKKYLQSIIKLSSK